MNDETASQPDVTQPREKRGPDSHCNATTRQGNWCKKPAGWGTPHAGTGRCRLHGGAQGSGRPPTRETTLRRNINARAKEVEKTSTLMDLRPRLSKLIALIEIHTEEMETAENWSGADFERAVFAITSAGQLVERIERIYTSRAPTQLELRAVYRELAKAATEFVPADRLQAFVQRIGAAVGESAPLQLTQAPPAHGSGEVEGEMCPTMPSISETDFSGKPFDSIPLTSESTFPKNPSSSGVPALPAIESSGHPDIIFSGKGVESDVVEGEVE